MRPIAAGSAWEAKSCLPMVELGTMSTTHYVFLIREKEFRVGKMWVTARLPVAALNSRPLCPLFISTNITTKARSYGATLPGQAPPQRSVETIG